MGDGVTPKVNCSSANKCIPQACNPGTGSCYDVPVNCDDSNPCTTDTCTVVNGTATCVNTPVTCAQPDLCMPTTCDILTGQCKNGTRKTCDDGKIK